MKTMEKGHFITSEESDDNFVGLRFQDGTPTVVFPHGFNISDDEKEQRKDVFRLLAVLQRFTEHREGNSAEEENQERLSFPITSYQYVIQDFLANGYYSEKEVRYVKGLKGKINWKRTIQQEQPQIDNGNVVYLNFQVKTNQINTDNLITKIHQYCVYQSLYRFGWLYLSSAYLPQVPTVKLNKKMFIAALNKALDNTFNDDKRKLFKSMINIVLEEDENAEIRDFSIGVNKFETVWERLIDYVFGEPDKERYFPHGTWHIISNGRINKSSALEPDTIMKYNGKIYVLDAKYYQFGVSGCPSDLPQTSSIQKQITYGKHIAEQMGEVSVEDVYNAFIMPFGSINEEKYMFVSVGTADWETYSKSTFNYAYVLGILIDTKWIVSEYVRHNLKEIDRLSELIEVSLSSFREALNKTE